MESIEKLQKQHATLEDLQGIVKTMKTLAAASIHQYENAVASSKIYKHNIEQGLYIATRKNSDKLPQKLNKNKGIASPHLYIVFGSDHGLCGRFNESINNYALNNCQNNKQAIFITIGARITTAFEHHPLTLASDYLLPGSTSGIKRLVQKVLANIDELQQSHAIQKVSLIFNKSELGKHYQTLEESLLPIDFSRFHQLYIPNGHKPIEQQWPSRTIPTHTIPKAKLVKHLVHQYLFILIFQACAESQASEQNSRLSTMQSAARNLDEHLNDLKIDLHRARQNKITTELIDVMTAYEIITQSSNTE